jgi:hypothetical protein
MVLPQQSEVMESAAFRRAFLLAVAGIVVIVAADALRAQAPAADTKPPAFEVATIKRSKSVQGGGSLGFQPGGRFRAINVPLRGLVAAAFGTEGQSLSYFQILGGPDWLTSDAFDITAKTDSSVPQDVTGASKQMPLLLRSLLEDRFNLKAHMETRQLPVYALTLTHPDGNLGSQLRRSDVDCLARVKAANVGTSPAPLPSGRLPCGTTFGQGTLSAGGITMPNRFAHSWAAWTDPCSTAPGFPEVLMWNSNGHRIGPCLAMGRTRRRMQ